MRVKEFNICQLYFIAGHLKVRSRHAALGVLYKQDVALQVGVQFNKTHELVLVVRRHVIGMLDVPQSIESLIPQIALANDLPQKILDNLTGLLMVHVVQDALVVQ